MARNPHCPVFHCLGALVSKDDFSNVEQFMDLKQDHGTLNLDLVCLTK